MAIFSAMIVGANAPHCRNSLRYLDCSKKIASEWRWAIRRCPSTVPCTFPSGESPNFRWIPSWEPNWESNRPKALLRGISLSEYGPGCLLSWKTNTGNTGRTVLGHRPRRCWWHPPPTWCIQPKSREKSTKTNATDINLSEEACS